NWRRQARDRLPLCQRTVQNGHPALGSVSTTLAARPLSARSLLRTLLLALRDGAGSAAIGSATPLTTLAFAPASRCANISLISSIPRSSCSSVIALTPPECSTCISRGTSIAQTFKYAAADSRRTRLNTSRPMLLPILSQIEQKALVERSARSLR